MYGAPIDNIPELERKRLQAVWELFHTELTFLYQHLLALRNVRGGLGIIDRGIYSP